MITTTLFLAKVCGVLTRVLTFCILFVSADAKTSAGAPFVICVARVFDPAKLYVTVMFGLAASNFVFISPNAAVSEAAPKTLRVTGAGVGVEVGGVELLLLLVLLLPQEQVRAECVENVS